MIALQLRRWRFGQVAPLTLGLTILVSVGGLSFALLQGWPLWLVGTATVIPWLPILTIDAARIFRMYQWLALFYVLVVTQTGHLPEHVAQMFQIHVLAVTAADGAEFSARSISNGFISSGIHGYFWQWWCCCATLARIAGCG